jgi:hypothetical protein
LINIFYRRRNKMSYDKMVYLELIHQLMRKRLTHNSIE